MINWKKRLKSGAMVFGSALVAAVVAIVPTVEFANFVQWVHDLASEAGVPAVMISLFTAVISQLWMQWRNSKKPVVASGLSETELY